MTHENETHLLHKTIIGVEHRGILYAGILDTRLKTVTTKEFVLPLANCTIIRDTYGNKIN